MKLQEIAAFGSMHTKPGRPVATSTASSSALIPCEKSDSMHESSSSTPTTTARSGSPIQAAVCLMLLIGGSWFFIQRGQFGQFVTPDSTMGTTSGGGYAFAAYEAEPAALRRSTSDSSWTPDGRIVARAYADLEAETERAEAGGADESASIAPDLMRRFENLRIATWALDAFGPSKLRSETGRRNLVRVIRQFDVIALQQVSSVERDLVPRIVDAVNEGNRRFDYVIGRPTGPADRPEQLVFLFDMDRVRVDRSQTYTVADPGDQFTFDPLVAWFTAAEPSADTAWTFSLVNVRVDLTRAAAEVALLPAIMKSVRDDGRREDDVVMTGLFQADDSYLTSAFDDRSIAMGVRSVATDLFNRHQTANILYNRDVTSEAIGRSGTYDFLRAENLSIAEAEATSSHLPVFAEFTANEGRAVIESAARR